MPLQVLIINPPALNVNARYENEGNRGQLLTINGGPVALRIVVDTAHLDSKLRVEASVRDIHGNVHETYYLSPNSWDHCPSETLMLRDVRLVKKRSEGTVTARDGQRRAFRIRFTARYDEMGGCEASCETEEMLDGSCDLKKMNPSWGYAESGQEIWINCARGVPIGKNKVTAIVSLQKMGEKTADCRVDGRVVEFNMPKLGLKQPLSKAIQASVRLKICHGEDLIMETRSIGFIYVGNGLCGPPNSSKASNKKREKSLKRNSSTRKATRTFVSSAQPEVKKSKYQPPERSPVSETLLEGPSKAVYYMDEGQPLMAERAQDTIIAETPIAGPHKQHVEHTQPAESNPDNGRHQTVVAAPNRGASDPLPVRSQLGQVTMDTTCEPQRLVPAPNCGNLELNSNCNLLGGTMLTHPNGMEMAASGLPVSQIVRLPAPATASRSRHLRSTSNLEHPPEEDDNDKEFREIIRDIYDQFPPDDQWESITKCPYPDLH